MVAKYKRLYIVYIGLFIVFVCLYRIYRDNHKMDEDHHEKYTILNSLYKNANYMNESSHPILLPYYYIILFLSIN